MLTPRFHLSQTPSMFTIIIRAPYCSLKELDVQIDEETNTFLFFCKPYYLRLQLPGSIIEESPKRHSKFDSDSGEFTFSYEKRHVSEEFENLELVTQFLIPKLDVNDTSQHQHPSDEGRKIEVLACTVCDDTPEENVDKDVAQFQYGFAQRGGYKYNIINHEFTDIFNINPFEVKLLERSQQRILDEDKHFNIDHYLADYIDCDEIDSLIAEKSPWKTQCNTNKCFTGQELDFLKDLPNIEYLLTPNQTQFAFNSLLDLLFGYCYDKRTTYFESSCESSWTIVKLSPTIQYFDSFSTAKDCIVASFRRALCYPLYRSFKLCQVILNDVKDILKLGAREIIKCLIDMYGIMLKGDSARYIVNHLFIRDYVIYCQKLPEKEWDLFVEEVMSLYVNKNNLGLKLEEIEALANEEDEGDEDEINTKLKNMALNKTTELDSDDCSPTSTSTSSSSCQESDAE